MKRRLWVGGALSVGIVITAVAGIALDQQKTAPAHAEQALRTSLDNPIETADSTTYNSLETSSILSALNLGLYTPNAKGNPVPAIADGEPSISEDGLTYTFRLKRTHWQNGSPVTADDFVYAWQRLVSPSHKSRNSARADFIKNATAIRMGQKPATMLGVRALGPYNLRIQMNKPTPYLAEDLASTPFLPIKRSFAQKLGKRYGDNAKHFMSNGPYVLNDWSGSHDKHWRLTPNAKYDLKFNPPFKAIDFQVLGHNVALKKYQSNDLDFCPLTSEEAKRYRDNRDFHTVRTTASGILFFNMQSGITVNANLRKAIAQGFDKHLLTQGQLFDGSRPLNGFISSGLSLHPGLPSYRSEAGEMLPYDFNKANMYWHRAQQQLGHNQITVRLNIADNALARTTGAFLKSQLQHNLPGLKIDLHKTSLDRRLRIEAAGNFDMMFETWTPFGTDPAAILKMNLADNGMNVSKYRDSTYDEYVTQIMQNNQTPRERRHLLIAAEKHFVVKDTAATGILQLGYPYLIRNGLHELGVMKNGSVNYLMTPAH